MPTYFDEFHYVTTLKTRIYIYNYMYKYIYLNYNIIIIGLYRKWLVNI